VNNGNEFETLGWSKRTLPCTEYLSYMFDWKGSWSWYGRNTKLATTTGRKRPHLLLGCLGQVVENHTVPI